MSAVFNMGIHLPAHFVIKLLTGCFMQYVEAVVAWLFLLIGKPPVSEPVRSDRTRLREQFQNPDIAGPGQVSTESLCRVLQWAGILEPVRCWFQKPEVLTSTASGSGRISQRIPSGVVALICID